METAQKINPRGLGKRKSIGLTAVSSIPSSIIKQVEKEIRRIKGL